MPGPNTWPIVLFSYMYVRADQTNVDPDTAALLKAFTDYVLSDKGQAGLEAFAFSGVPPAVAALNTRTLLKLALPAEAKANPFTLESSTAAGKGMGARVLSAKRRSWADVDRAQLRTDHEADVAGIAAMAARIEALEASVAALTSGGDTHEMATANDSRSKAALALAIVATLLALAVATQVFCLGGSSVTRAQSRTPAGAPCGKDSDSMESNMPEYEMTQA